MRIRRWTAIFVAVTAIGLGLGAAVRSGQDAGGISTARAPVVVSGQERLVWDQYGDPKLIGELRFVAYIDGMQLDLPDTRCTPQSAFHSQCESPLPSLALGAHALNVVAVRRRDSVESGRGLPLNLTQATEVPPDAPLPVAAPRRRDPVSTRAATTTPDCSVAVVDDRAAVLATSDGTLEAWPRRGAALPIQGTAPLPDGWALRGVTARERDVYVLLAAAKAETTALRVLQYAEAKGKLSLVGTVLDQTIDRVVGRPRLRQSPEGKLHVLLLEQEARAGEPFVLELAAASATPIGPAKLVDRWRSQRPLAFEWSRPGGEGWVLENERGGVAARQAAGSRPSVPLRSAATATPRLLFAGGLNGSETDVLMAIFADGSAVHTTRARGRWQPGGQLTLPSLGVVHDGVVSPNGDLVYCSSRPDARQGAEYDVRWRTFRR
jgi:hypothetical protein